MYLYYQKSFNYLVVSETQLISDPDFEAEVLLIIKNRAHKLTFRSYDANDQIRTYMENSSYVYGWISTFGDITLTQI